MAGDTEGYERFQWRILPRYYRATDNYPNDFFEFTEVLKFTSEDVRY
jgi:hypothetical protein